MRLAVALVLLLSPLLEGCSTVRRGPPTSAGYPEAYSLLGTPLYAPELPLEQRQRLEADLAEAYLRYEVDTEDADAIIWLGRRVAYLGRYRDAVAIFTEGVRKHPDDARMYRHRGHRWITLRRFDRAVSDLEHAARLLQRTPDEIEPDGIPNALGIPLTTLHYNVWYHLGLAHYLRGDFGRSASAFRNALTVSTNDDARVSATNWAYLALRRQGRGDEAVDLLATIRPGLEMVENAAYLRMLEVYQGGAAPEGLLSGSGTDPLTSATEGYGAGAWFLLQGRRDAAEAVFWRVISAENWAPFGYIAAEVELTRLRRR
jgi:tetratricopeptide (TPR) repeat protein